MATTINPIDLMEQLSTRRTVRKFREGRRIEQPVLERIVQAGHYAPFSCNLQPLSYVVVQSQEGCEKVFPYVTWARHLPHMAPAEREKPVGYILPLMDKNATSSLAESFNRQGGEELQQQALRSFDVSYGIALGFMIAQAHIEGVSVCPMAGIEEADIRNQLGIGPDHEIVTLLALGYAQEIPRAVSMEAGKFKYYYNDRGELVVPKRELSLQWR